MVGGGSKRVLSLAGREADIVGMNPRLAEGFVGPKSIASATPAHYDQRLGWVRAAAGERFDEIELQCLTFFGARRRQWSQGHRGGGAHVLDVGRRRHPHASRVDGIDRRDRRRVDVPAPAMGGRVLGRARGGDGCVRAGGGPTDTEPDRVVAQGARAERVGILGGTFDPIHIGHLVAAEWTRHALGLDRVLLMVANEPWQKTPTRRVTPAEDRYAMVAAAADGIEWLEAGRMEIDRGGPSYTIDTVSRAQEADARRGAVPHRGRRCGAAVSTWHHVDELIGLVTLVVVDRGGVAVGAGARRLGRSST